MMKRAALVLLLLALMVSGCAAKTPARQEHQDQGQAYQEETTQDTKETVDSSSEAVESETTGSAPLTLEEAIAMVEEYYNGLAEDDGTYVVFIEECIESDGQYILTVRYQMSDSEAQEILDNGGFPSANILAATVTVDPATGEMSIESGY